MKFHSILVTLITGFLFLQQTAHAQGGGAVGGGGGRAVVCRDANKKIISAEMLDLYEAKEVHQLTLLPNLKNQNQEYTQALFQWLRYSLGEQVVSVDLDKGKVSFKIGETIPPVETDVLDLVQRDFLKKINWVLMPAKLQDVKDSMEPIVPENCQTEQVANYYLEEQILVQKEIWDAFDSKSRAALMLHELFYKDRRQNAEDHDSRYSRRVVGYLMSTTSLTSPRAAFFGTYGTTKTFACGGQTGSRMGDNKGFYFRAYQNGVGLEFIFLNIGQSHDVDAIVTSGGYAYGSFMEYLFGLPPANGKTVYGSSYVYAKDEFGQEIKFKIKPLPNTELRYNDDSEPVRNQKIIEITRLNEDGNDVTDIIGCYEETQSQK